MTVNKRRAVRSMLARLGMQAKSKQVADVLESYGIEVSGRLVGRVKLQILLDEARAARQRAKRPPKPRVWNRPQQRKIPPRRG